MNDPDSTSAKSDSEKPMENLRALLCDQVEKYQQMQQLEEQLAGLIQKKAFAEVSKNTKQKAVLMVQINASDAEIAPLIRELMSDSGTLPDAEAEELRGKAIALVEKLQELEVENRAGLEGFRDGMTQNFREAKQAKRAAHGYKQSKSIYRSKHDTRR